MYGKFFSRSLCFHQRFRPDFAGFIGDPEKIGARRQVAPGEV